MFVFLQDFVANEGLFMVGWMPIVLWRLKKILDLSVSAHKIKGRRNIVSLFDNFDWSGQFDARLRRWNRIQRLIYYTSKVLHNIEVRYSRAKKMIYALIISSQRLRLYFQAYLIVVLIDQSLKAILHQPDTLGRMAKWTVKLDVFDIQYYLCLSMKT